MKHTKKIVSLLLALVMLIGLLPITASAASAPSVLYWTHTNDPEGWYSFGSISFAPVPGVDVYNITLYKNNEEVYSFTSWWENDGEDMYVVTHLISELVKNGSGSYTFTVSSCDEDENMLATSRMSSPIVYTKPATTLAVPRLTQNRNNVIAWNAVENAAEYYFELDFVCDEDTFLSWTGNLIDPYFDTEIIDGWEMDIPPGYTKNDVDIFFRVNASPWNINEFSPSSYTDWVLFNSGDLGGNAPGGGGGGGGGTIKPDTPSYPKYPEDLEWDSHGLGIFSFTPAKDVLDYVITLYKDSTFACDYKLSLEYLEPSVNFPWFIYEMTRLGSGEYYFTITTPNGMETYSDTMTYTPAPRQKYLHHPKISGDIISWTDYDASNTEYYTVGFYLNYGDDNYLPFTYRQADETSFDLSTSDVYDLYHKAVEEKHAEDAIRYPKSAAKLVFAPYAIPKDLDTYQIGLCYYTPKHSTGKSGTLEGGISWELKNGVLTLSGSGNIPDFDSVVAPWWDYREEITKAVIGSGITGIGKNALSSLPNMTSVSIPNTVTELGAYAFAYDAALTSAPLPSGVTKIDDYAFLGCGLRSITLPKNLATLGTYAFAGCEHISGSVTIPAGITEVPDGVFQSCQNLTAVTLHDKITKIGEEAFSNTGITQITLPDSLTAIGESAFSGTKLKSIVIPDSVTELGAYALSFCYDLKDVTLPKKLTVIRQGLFQSSAINTVILPQSIEKIEREAFYDSHLTEITIPSRVREIPDLTFLGCTYLHTVRMLGNVTKIGESAFQSCSNLSKINLPNTITSIGRRAFWYCTKLANITLPNKLKTIDGAAFEGAGLTEIHIPDSVTSIGVSAFKDCKSLTKATLSKGMTEVPQSMFQNASALTEIVIPYGCTEVALDAFYYCTNLKKVTLPITVTNISSRAFQNVKADIYYGGNEEAWNAINGSSYLTRWNTIHYNALAKTDFAEVTVTEDSKTQLQISSLESACVGKTVLCGLYLNGVLQDFVFGTYTEEGLSLSSNATAYDKIKIMVWNSLTDTTPATNSETIDATFGSAS